MAIFRDVSGEDRRAHDPRAVALARTGDEPGRVASILKVARDRELYEETALALIERDPKKRAAFETMCFKASGLQAPWFDNAWGDNGALAPLSNRVAGALLANTTERDVAVNMLRFDERFERFNARNLRTLLRRVGATEPEARALVKAGAGFEAAEMLATRPPPSGRHVATSANGRRYMTRRATPSYGTLSCETGSTVRSWPNSGFQVMGLPTVLPFRAHKPGPSPGIRIPWTDCFAH